MRHFAPSEYRCKCDRPNCPAPLELDARLARLLDDLRDEVGPLIINSGIRCPFHNASVGGTADSDHITGEGVDIRCRNSRLRHSILSTAYRLGANRVGIAKTFIHIGVGKINPPDVAWLY